MMRYVLLATCFLLGAGAAFAQEPSSLASAAASRPAAASLTAPRDAESAQARAPQPPPRRERRRGSMVGYIEDATVGSQIRVRFDASFDGRRPDRAEFFYAKCGCYRGLAEAAPAFYDPDAPGPAPGVVTEYDARHLLLEAEYAVHQRISVFAEVPFRWLTPSAFVPGTGSFASTSGLSDIRAGVKLALLQTDDATVSALVRADFPSGDAGKGLGTDHGSIVPMLLYFQRLSDRATLESQFGTHHPFSGSAGVPTNSSEKFSGDVLTYGVGAAYDVFRGSRARVAPVVELVGWRVLGGFQTEIPGTVGVASPVDGLDIVNLKLGVRTVVDDRLSFYGGYGRKLTDAGWYSDIVRLELRYGF